MKSRIIHKRLGHVMSDEDAEKFLLKEIENRIGRYPDTDSRIEEIYLSYARLFSVLVEQGLLTPEEIYYIATGHKMNPNDNLSIK